MPITEYGKVIREIRASIPASLRQMARAVKFSPAQLSAVEMGERRITGEFLQNVINFLRSENVKTNEITRLCAAADRTRRFVDVSALDPAARAKVAAFARRLSDTVREE